MIVYGYISLIILRGNERIINIKLADSNKPGIPVVSVSGELDLSSKNDLVELIPEIISKGHSGIIADVINITYIDSAGIEAIFRLLSQAQDKSLITVFVIGDNEYIYKKFKELGLMSFSKVKLSKSLEEAESVLAA